MKSLKDTNWITLLNAEWLRVVLLAVLLVVFSQVLAKTLWIAVFGPYDPVPLADNMLVMDHNTTSSHLANGNAAQDWQLFGKPSVNKTAKTQPEKAPETRLKLTLLGVFAHGDNALSGAIIASEGQKTAKLYHPGDSLPGHASLYKVYPDKVLLKRLGHTETLSLEREKLQGGISTDTTSQNTSAPTNGTGRNLSKQRKMIIRQLALKPVQAGATDGYKVTDKIAKSVQNAVGLRSGDVILSVNGFQLGTKKADRNAMESFYERGEAKVKIQRGSRQMTLTYPP